MTANIKWWALGVLVLVVFGVAVFAATRAYYKHEEAARVARTGLPPAGDFQPPVSLLGPGAMPDAPQAPPAPGADLQSLVAAGDQHFEKREFAEAAQAYEQALALSPHDPELYNNVGLTLHYIGRSADALEKLKEGTKVDPKYQRVWLTLGFVEAHQNQMAEAKHSFQRAIDLGADTPVGQEAKRLLDQLR